jgi:arylformamidase
VRIHDVSVPLSSDLPFWPDNPRFSRHRALSIEKGDPANVSQISMGVHTATHVDAPVHFFEGAGGIDTVAVDSLVGPCLVVEANPPGDELRPDDLPITDHVRVLFKTRNSGLWARHDDDFQPNFVSLSPELATCAVERGMKLVGVDYLSVESFHAPSSYPVHHTLLGGGVVPVEGLDLSQVEPGEYQLFCLPLRIVGSDAGPARVILTQPDGQNDRPGSA